MGDLLLCNTLISALLLGAGQMNTVGHLLPLVISISIAYAATRHEDVRLILRHALRVAGWTIGFMLLVFVLLLWIGSLT